MRLTAGELNQFAQVCVNHLPPGRLVAHIQKYRIIADYPTFEKEHTLGTDNPVLHLTKAILEVLNQRETACDLAEQLILELAWNNEFNTEVAPFTRSVRTGGDTHEAFNARRDHFLRTLELSRLLDEIAPVICCLVGEFDLDGIAQHRSGTGFLVGPDLILTAMHVVDTLIVAHRKAEVPDHFRAVFDHDSGRDITGLAMLDDLENVRVVKFHGTDWLVAGSDKSIPDGTDDLPEMERLDRYRTHLDFALIRLAEPVGNQTVDPAGGKVRGWLKTDQPGPIAYSNDSRVIIPQHPGGSCTLVDFGRVTQRCSSQTRVISKIESAPGSSGAPCLSNALELVAMHNAAYEPNGILMGNQAIRFDRIRPLIEDSLPSEAPGRSEFRRHWNAAAPGEELAPIIGRDIFLNWIKAIFDAPDAAAAQHADRIYAADAPKPGAGKSFSMAILTSILRDNPTDQLVLFGGNGPLIPDRVENFAAALAQGFGIGAEKLADMPRRPTARLPTDSSDGDKVQRWTSLDMPEWFTRLLTKHRALATDASGIPRQRWRNAWIVLDDLPERSIPPEIENFVAGLIGADIDEARMATVLKSLKWLFLGYVPDFLQEVDATTENLDPDQVDLPSLVSPIAAALVASDFEVDGAKLQAQAATFRQSAEIFLPQLEHHSTLLAVCQHLIAKSIQGYLQNGRLL